MPTHAALARRVLEAGKHCFVEKPMARSAADAEGVVAAAERAGRTLMVGHLLEYHPGVVKLKELIDGGELGRVLYIYGNRLNLGKLRADENALWSLGAHDVSVLLRLAGEEPHEVEARGESYMREGVEDVVFCFLRFPSGLAAHLHLSWLDPHKERRFTVVGDQRMATFDDMALEGKIAIYDKGFDEPAGTYGEYITRSGDIWSPADLERRAAAHRVRALRPVRSARARRRSPTAPPACASCACSRRSSARSTPAAARAWRAASRSPGLSSSRSASTISAISSSKLVRGSQPSSRLALAGSPTSRSTSAGRLNASSITTYCSQSRPTLLEGELDAAPHGVRLAGRDHVVVRRVLLEHQPHRLDVVLRVAPVALGVEVAEPQLVRQAELDRRGVPGDLAGHELQPATRDFVVEEDPGASRDRP